MDFKYVRIQGREDAYMTKYPKGIFGMCWRLVLDGKMNAEDAKKFKAIERWFVENLPEKVGNKSAIPLSWSFYIFGQISQSNLPQTHNAIMDPSNSLTITIQPIAAKHFLDFNIQAF